MTAAKVRWTVVGAVCTAAFVALGMLVSRQPLAVDMAIAGGLRGPRQWPAGTVATAVSDVLGPVLPVLAACVVLIAALVCWRRHAPARAALFLRVALVLVLCRLTSVVFKPVFSRVRPKVYADLSYPSGHVVSTAATGFAAVLLCLWLAPRLVRKVLALSVVATVLCAASRLVLGVHWLTDTIGSVLVVLGVGLLASVILRLLPPDPVPTDAKAA